MGGGERREGKKRKKKVLYLIKCVQVFLLLQIYQNYFFLLV